MITKSRLRSQDLIQEYRNSIEWEAEKELRRWGRYHASEIFQSHMRCTLAELTTLGLHIPCHVNDRPYYPDILQTQRVWAFMPFLAQRAIYLHYAFKVSKSRKALMLGISRNKFEHQIRKGFNFYLKFRDTNFSKFGW